MSFLSHLLNYWFLWLAAALLVAASSGFDQTMLLYVGDKNLRLGCWQFIQGCAGFLLITGLLYTWLDYRRKALWPRWFKPVHLSLCLAFCVLTPVYFQELNNKRLSNPAGYYGGDHQYYEDLYFPTILFLSLFVLAQVWFVVAFVRACRRHA